MSGSSFRVSVQNARAIEGLARLSARLVDLRPVFQEIAGVLADDTEQAFEDERDPTTLTPWQLLADRTIRQRAGEGTWPGEILQRTGQLAASVVTAHGKDFAQIGSNKVYAAIQQLGGSAGVNSRTEIPARPYLGLSQEGADEALAICLTYLEGSF